MLGLLRAAQVRLKPSSPPLTVIRPVLTRWTSHFLAYRRLLELRRSIETIIEEDEDRLDSQLITGTASAKHKAREIMQYLKDDAFWKAVKQYEISQFGHYLFHNIITESSHILSHSRTLLILHRRTTLDSTLYSLHSVYSILALKTFKTLMMQSRTPCATASILNG